MRNTFRVLFYIKRTAPRRNGDVPVMARITINGERAQLAVRAYVDPALWDVRTGLAAGRSRRFGTQRETAPRPPPHRTVL